MVIFFTFEGDLYNCGWFLYIWGKFYTFVEFYTSECPTMSRDTQYIIGKLFAPRIQKSQNVKGLNVSGILKAFQIKVYIYKVVWAVNPKQMKIKSRFFCWDPGLSSESYFENHQLNISIQQFISMRESEPFFLVYIVFWLLNMVIAAFLSLLQCTKSYLWTIRPIPHMLHDILT